MSIIVALFFKSKSPPAETSLIAVPASDCIEVLSQSGVKVAESDNCRGRRRSGRRTAVLQLFGTLRSGVLLHRVGRNAEEAGASFTKAGVPADASVC
jgi:hypothetical protein